MSVIESLAVHRDGPKGNHPSAISSPSGEPRSAVAGAPYSFVIRLSCENRPGIVAAISTRLFDAGFNIQDSQQFDDMDSGRFFVRIVFGREEPADSRYIEELLAQPVTTFGMEFSIHAVQEKRKVLLLASSFDHCLADLLYRWKTQEIQMDIVGIVSNHALSVYEHLDFGAIPFHYLPVKQGGKAAQESQIWNIVEQTEADLVVLARYMQILSDDLSRKLSGRCINIHHSFLPGFKGAKPYHQAFERGVKIIGATAHYVTADLDEGPIIEQDVERISHRDLPEQLVRKGRDIERRVLARAVRYHLEDRVILNGSKTVVFPE